MKDTVFQIYYVLFDNCGMVENSEGPVSSRKIHARKQFSVFHGIMSYFSFKLWNPIYTWFQ